MAKGNNNDNQVRESGNGQLNESHGGGGSHGTPDFGPDKRRE